jgi:hypothetical protein
MADPRLNSVHLDFPRRDDFRNARDALLGSRGTQTLALENGPDDWAGPGEHTMIQDPRERVPTGVHCWLTDQRSIYPLKVGINTIGRLPDNDVVVQAPYVSRRHCAILVHLGENCELHDIASKNGTFVNGHKLSGPTPLQSGDEIRMCDLRLVFLTRTGPGGGDDPAHAPTCSE